MVNAEHIHAQQLLVLLEARLQELEVPVDSSAGNADVQLAVKVRHEGLEAGLEGLLGGDVDGVVRGADAVGGGDFKEGGDGRDDVEDGDVGASFGEAFREGEATAAGAAGDEGCAAGERELGGLVRTVWGIGDVLSWSSLCRVSGKAITNAEEPNPMAALGILIDRERRGERRKEEMSAVVMILRGHLPPHPSALLSPRQLRTSCTAMHPS